MKIINDLSGATEVKVIQQPVFGSFIKALLLVTSVVILASFSVVSL